MSVLRQPRPLVRLLACLLTATGTAGFAAVPTAAPQPASLPGLPPVFPEVRVQSVTLPRGDLADVYFPVPPPSLTRPVTDAFPLVALLQGALVDKSHYERLGRLLAAQGLVVVIPNHLRTLPGFPPQSAFTDVNVVTDVLTAIGAADADPGSPLYRIVDTDHMGLVGHSLGGSIGLYAVAGRCLPTICDGTYERPAALKAAVFYGTSLLGSDGAAMDLDTSAAPVALVQGSLDGVALPKKADLTYPSLETPRALITIKGANHYAICDENNPAGAKPDPSAPTLEQDVATEAVARWTGLWLRAQLQGDPLAREWIYQIGGSPDGVVQVSTN
jgi:predicted dienelactone hydrolase